MALTYIINGRFLTQKLTGVHRYAFEMCKALQSIGFEFIILAPPLLLNDYKHDFNIIQIGHLKSHLWEQIELPFYVRKNYRNSILINFTGLGSLFYNRNICTIHDLSFLENPKWFSRSYYLFYKYLTPIVARKAIKIITVSNFSKSEIIRELNIKEDKISVIYNAASSALTKDLLIKEKNKDFILSVSSIDPRKNQLKLVEAFKLLNSDLQLVIIGKKNKVFGKHELEDENPNIIFTGYLSDEELSWHYQNATVFVYPSLYEGFGIPNLEAMVNNCPVITSAIKPHVEVCGDAAIYFDPNDINDISQKIKIVLENNVLREELILKGKKKVNDYSWKTSAIQLVRKLEDLEG